MSPTMLKGAEVPTEVNITHTLSYLPLTKYIYPNINTYIHTKNKNDDSPVLPFSFSFAMLCHQQLPPSPFSNPA